MQLKKSNWTNNCGHSVNNDGDFIHNPVTMSFDFVGSKNIEKWSFYNPYWQMDVRPL